MTKNPNEYTAFEEETYIHLTDKNGNHKAFAIIDTEDLEKVSSFRWYQAGEGYVVTRLKSRKLLYLHQLILGYREGLQNDHINRYKLDNQKNNLRFCTRNQNAYNTGLRSDNISGYKGVRWRERDKKWVAQIKVKGKDYHLGYFDILEDAVNARTTAEEIRETMGD